MIYALRLVLRCRRTKMTIDAMIKIVLLKNDIVPIKKTRCDDSVGSLGDNIISGEMINNALIAMIAMTKYCSYISILRIFLIASWI